MFFLGWFLPCHNFYIPHFFLILQGRAISPQEPGSCGQSMSLKVALRSASGEAPRPSSERASSRAGLLGAVGSVASGVGGFVGTVVTGVVGGVLEGARRFGMD